MTQAALVIQVGAFTRWTTRQVAVGNAPARGGLLINDPYLADMHALLSPDNEGSWWLMDLGNSPNGCWVLSAARIIEGDDPTQVGNFQRVHRHKLAKGDRLRMGRTQIIVVPCP